MTVASSAISTGERGRAEAAAVLVMVIWAANFVIHKAAITVVPPVGFTFLRITLAAVSMLVLCRLLDGGIGLPRRDLARVLVLGGVGYGVYQILWPIALSSTTAGNSALVIASSPIFTALVAMALGMEAASWYRSGGVAIAFVGVGLVVVGGGAGPAGPGIGDLLTVICAACWGATLALTAPLLVRVSPFRMASWALTGGAIVLALPGSWQLVTGDLSGAGPEILLAIAFTGIVAAGLANVVVFRSVKVIGPSRFANFQFLTPVFTVALGALFLGEGVAPAQVAGGIAIVAGILVARRAPLGRPVGSPPATSPADVPPLPR